MNARTVLLSAVVLASCAGSISDFDGGEGGGLGGGTASGGGSGGGTVAGGGSGGGATTGGGAGGGAGGGSGGGTGGGAAPVSFATSIVPIFRAKCAAACHGGQWQDTNTVIYNRLKGTTLGTTACANQARLVVSDAANSLVVKKISGSQTCGGRMPQVSTGPTTSRDCAGTECVTASDINLISTWINQGARDN